MIKIEHVEKGKIYFLSTIFDKGKLENTSKGSQIIISTETIDSIYDDLIKRNEKKFLTKKYYIEIVKGDIIFDISISCREGVNDFTGRIVLTDDNSRIFLGLLEPKNKFIPVNELEKSVINKEKAISTLDSEEYISYVTKAKSGTIEYALEMKKDPSIIGFGSISISTKERIDFIWDIYRLNRFTEKMCSTIEFVVPDIIYKSTNNEFETENLVIMLDPKDNGKLILGAYYKNDEILFIEEELKIGEGVIWDFLYSKDMEENPIYIEMKQELFK